MISIITATHQRPSLLQEKCLASLLSQTSQEFEWVVVNDGGCPITRQIVLEAKETLSVQYFEVPHQGLIASRNLALKHAKGEFIAFLDDDNLLHPPFVAEILDYFEQYPAMMMCNPVRRQRRDMYDQDGQLMKKGKEFLKPALDALPADFIKNKPNAWFDSNGFVHRRSEQLSFNPEMLIMSDYEYLLRCFSLFGQEAFGILPKELVLYIQTNQGIIGTSRFSSWLKEFEYLWGHRETYKVFQEISPEPWMMEQIQELREKAYKDEDLPGFSSAKKR